MSRSHAILMTDSRFWIRYRRHTYGPFDYEWSPDFCGVEFRYQNAKFGEYCGQDELFADLSGEGLPGAVAKVASIVIGSTVRSILGGLPEAERLRQLELNVERFGYVQFLPVERRAG